MPGAEDQNKEKTGEGQPGAAGADENNNKNTDPNAGHEGGNQNSDDDSVYADPEKAKAYAKKLRDEAAKSRKRAADLESRLNALDATQKKLKAALGGEDEEVDPAELAQSLQTQNEALQVELGITQLGYENGIPAEGMSYFKFLLAQKFESLEEGEEITEDDIKDVISEVSKFTTGKGGNSTGLNTGKRPDGDKSVGVTVEQFSKMSLTEKSDLYTKSPEQYQKLFNEARSKRLI